MVSNKNDAVENYVKLKIGVATAALMVAGTDTLKEHFGFSEDQCAMWYALTREGMLNNVEIMGTMARNDSNLT